MSGEIVANQFGVILSPFWVRHRHVLWVGDPCTLQLTVSQLAVSTLRRALLPLERTT